MKVDFCGRKCLEVDKGVWGGASYLPVLPLGAGIKSIMLTFQNSPRYTHDDLFQFSGCLLQDQNMLKIIITFRCFF